MSSPHQPKRRRMDSIGIHKPFVSPLKRAATADATPLRNSNLRKITTPSAPPTYSSHDPKVLAVQQAIRHLEHRIRELRTQNTILQQATTVTSSTTPTTSTQPSRLETKWRKASQAAAEEVFSDFAARIRDNGGYTAFLKQQSNYKPFEHQNDDQDIQGNEEDWRDEMGDVLTARGKKQRRQENEDKAKKKEEEGQDIEEQEEQELGMGSMLQVLNIPPEVIGWDEKEQAWK